MHIPFDNNTGEKYSFSIEIEEIETGDGIVLTLNRKACQSFADLFAALASFEEASHIHLGYDHGVPQGPGVRIEIIDS